jgi:hypothetical protein
VGGIIMTIQDNIEIKNQDDLLAFFMAEAEKGNKQWFGWLQQKITGISLVHQIASRHADKMTPDEIVDYVNRLNSSIFTRMIKGGGV